MRASIHGRAHRHSARSACCRLVGTHRDVWKGPFWSSTASRYYVVFVWSIHLFNRTSQLLGCAEFRCCPVPWPNCIVTKALVVMFHEPRKTWALALTSATPVILIIHQAIIHIFSDLKGFCYYPARLIARSICVLCSSSPGSLIWMNCT
jgi:hypothetical protein